MPICKSDDGVTDQEEFFGDNGRSSQIATCAAAGPGPFCASRPINALKMNAPVPHFLLFSESRCPLPGLDQSAGQWRFVLEAVDGSSKLVASDQEPGAIGERLELLAVVRGLEALDQPSRVTLVTASRSVDRGLRHGLPQWRENGWQWERFGKMAPVRNHDLWQRIDRALQYHRIECRTWRLDPPHPTAAGAAALCVGRRAAPRGSARRGRLVRGGRRRKGADAARGRLGTLAAAARRWLAHWPLHRLAGRGVWAINGRFTKRR